MGTRGSKCYLLYFVYVKLSTIKSFFKVKCISKKDKRIPKVIEILPHQVFISKLEVLPGTGVPWNHEAQETLDYAMRKEITGYPVNGMLSLQGLADPMGV